MLEPQRKPCRAGEASRPTSVGIVLDRRDVLLRDPRGRVVTRAPTAGDLWALAAGYYLDLPGNPLRPGCRYEREFRTRNEGERFEAGGHLPPIELLAWCPVQRALRKRTDTRCLETPKRSAI